MAPIERKSGETLEFWGCFCGGFVPVSLSVPASFGGGDSVIETEAELAVLGLWRDILGPVPIGLENDFISVGGSSLRAMQLISRVRARYGVDLSVRRLFEEGATVRAITRWIEGRRSGGGRGLAVLGAMKRVGAPTVREVIGRVREVVLAAYAHQEAQYEKVVEALQPERKAGHAPLVQLVFAFQNALLERIPLPGLELSLMETDTGTSKFDLTMIVKEVGEGLLATAEYNTDLYDRETMAGLLDQYRTLLGGVVAGPEVRISELPLVAGEDRCRIIVEWNKTEREYLRDKRVEAVFEEEADRVPDEVAVLFGGEELRYRELHYRANQLAEYLIELGIRPGVNVGICLERSAELVVAMLAVLKAGGVMCLWVLNIRWSGWFLRYETRKWGLW